METYHTNKKLILAKMVVPVHVKPEHVFFLLEMERPKWCFVAKRYAVRNAKIRPYASS